jgi:MFS family permease
MQADWAGKVWPVRNETGKTTQKTNTGETMSNEHGSNKAVYRGAWGVLTLLFLVNLLNFIDRTIPAVLLEDIRKAYQLNDFWLGMLGTAFTLVYAICGLPLGRLADTWVRKYVLAGGVTVWSGFTALSGMMPGFASFFAIRLGVGVGEASCAPAAVSMIGDMFPPAKRGRAMGLFMLGLPLGILISFIAIAKIRAVTGSWQAPFIYAAVPGFLLAVVMLFIREPVRGSQESYATKTDKVDKPFKKVLAIKTIWWISLSGVTVNMAAYGTNTFFKAMLERYYLVDSLKAGTYAAVVLGLTGLLALTLGAFVADWAHKRSINGRLRLGAFSLLLAAPLVWLALAQPPGGDMGRFLLLYATGWVLFFMYYVSVYTAVQDVVEPRLRATAMSIYFAAQYLLGAAFGTIIIGGLSDFFAKQAMAAQGLTTITEAIRGIGLHSAMFAVPVMLVVTGVTLLLASRTYLVDVEKVKHSAAM